VTAAEQPATARRDVFIVANNIDEIGGLQRVVHTLAEGFAGRGHRVELIGVSPGPTTDNIVEGPTPYGRHVLWSEADGGPPSGRRRGRRPPAPEVERLNELFRTAREGIVIVGQIFAMAWVAAADTRHLRVIGMSHESYEASRGITPTSRGSTRYARILRYYPDVDLFLLLTRQDADKFEKDGLCNVGVMHNPLTLWPERPSSLTNPTVVAIGRLEIEKRYDRLIDAFALMAQDREEWSLRIYGDGSLRDALAERIRDRGLTGRAHLMGSTDDVAAALQEASLLALSSEQEGLPLVLAEAMATGVPCIAFDCAPGIREIIRDGEDGLVVRLRDVPAMAAALGRLADDEGLRRTMGSAARRNIERFRMDRVLDQWERVFEIVER
jgi:glycosyltransferase involved in cell wall biosynthesis